jgi:hypothetical protein
MSDENVTPNAPTPVEDIKPFFLTEAAHDRVRAGKPDGYLPKDALPYLRQETGFIPLPPEKPEWPPKLTRQVGCREKDCPHCFGGQQVERLCVGEVTKLRIYRLFPCLCKLYMKFFRRWMNIANVPELCRVHTINNLEDYHNNFKNFNYDPENPDEPSSFKNLCTTEGSVSSTKRIQGKIMSFISGDITWAVSIDAYMRS